jgi:hypothetical protein
MSVPRNRRGRTTRTIDELSELFEITVSSNASATKPRLPAEPYATGPRRSSSVVMAAAQRGKCRPTGTSSPVSFGVDEIAIAAGVGGNDRQPGRHRFGGRETHRFEV